MALLTTRLRSGVIQWSNPYVTAVLGLLVLGLGSVDCSSQSAAVDTPAEESVNLSEQSHVVDLGVLFADRESWFCYPLRQFGIENASDIIRIESSCDCVSAEVVGYVDATNRSVSGLSISVAPDTDAAVAASLIVELNLHLTNSPPVAIRLRFLSSLRK